VDVMRKVLIILSLMKPLETIRVRKAEIDGPLSRGLRSTSSLSSYVSSRLYITEGRGAAKCS
jgi:hypothetical protein